MKISYFEEFPTTENLSKLSLLKGKPTIILASKTVQEFQTHTKTWGKKANFIFWPTLPIEDGYWISPWSNPKALNALFAAILKHKTPTMLDLEPAKKRYQLLTKAYRFPSNKRKIKNFIQTATQNKIPIYTVESSHIPQKLSRLFGLSYHPKLGHQQIGMYYTSFARPFLSKQRIDNRMKKAAKTAAHRKMSLGIGLTAVGILGWEPLYKKPSFLKDDLRACKKAGVKEAIIFRLGGMNKDYAKIVNNF